MRDDYSPRAQRAIRELLERQYGVEAVSSVGTFNHKENEMVMVNLSALSEDKIAELGEEIIKELSRRRRARKIFEPTGVGTTIRFAKKFNGSVLYFYAAIRTPKGWSVTGRTTMNGIPWKSLIDFIKKDEVDVNTALLSIEVLQHSHHVIAGNVRNEMINETRADEDGGDGSDADAYYNR